MRIALWPLVTRSALVTAYRPAAQASSEAPFRTLRGKNWVTAGVTVIPHKNRSAQGRLTMFSSLNLEAARQARLGHRTAALRLAKAARELETRPDFVALASELGRLPSAVARAVVEGDIPREASPELARLVRTIAKATDVRRRTLSKQCDLIDVTTGTVIEVKRDHVRVAAEDGNITLVPKWYSEVAHRQEIGTQVAILSDRLDTRALIQPWPAIEVDRERTAAGQFEFSPADFEFSGEDAAHILDEPAPLRVLVPVKLPA